MTTIEIATPPRCGTVTTFFLLEAARRYDNLDFSIITNRHESSCFENLNNFNVFVSRNPLDAIASIFMYEEIPYNEIRCNEIIEDFQNFYHYFNINNRSNVGYIDFNYLINNELSVLKKLILWIGFDLSVANNILLSDNFEGILDRLKKKDLSRSINKQHFPRIVDENKKKDLKQQIALNKNFNNLVEIYNNTKTIINNTSHTLIGKIM